MPGESMPGAVMSGLQAAVLLARGRAEGLRLLDNDLGVAARSFWAAAISLPAFLCLRLMDWAADGPPAHPRHEAALDLIFYVIGWVGFVLISRQVVAAMGRAREWPRFVAVWNWCNVIQYVLLVVAGIPLLLGAPDWVDEAAGLIAFGWALWIEWFGVRCALNISGLAAAGIVALDAALGLVLSGLTDTVLSS